jgi:hypothetical protein
LILISANISVCITMFRIKNTTKQNVANPTTLKRDVLSWRLNDLWRAKQLSSKCQICTRLHDMAFWYSLLVTRIVAVVRTSNILRKSSSSVSQDILCCYYNWQPVTMFTAACHWTLFWTNIYALLLQDQLPFNGRQDVNGGLFPFSHKTLYTVILRVLHVQHITSFLTYDQTISHEQYNF